MGDGPRCVVDTNVLISAGLIRSSTPGRVLDWVLQNGLLLTSVEARDEFASRFIGRSKFDRYATPTERRDFVADTLRTAEVVAVTSTPAICADPNDDTFVALAVDGRADVIVTGNTRDFLAEHAGVPVLTPARFAERYLATPPA